MSLASSDLSLSFSEPASSHILFFTAIIQKIFLNLFLYYGSNESRLNLHLHIQDVYQI